MDQRPPGWGSRGRTTSPLVQRALACLLVVRPRVFSWDRTFDIGVLLLEAPTRTSVLYLQALVRAARPTRRRLLIAAAQLGLLGGLLSSIAVFVSADKTVTISVDGVSTTARTFSGTVSGVLAHEHITLGQHDVVTPALGAHLKDHGAITIRRGRPIQLTVGTRQQAVWVTATTVGEALAQLGLDGPGDYVSAATTSPIGLGGLALVVREPQTVRIAVDGAVRTGVTTDARVEQLLASNRVTMGPTDRLSVSPGTYPLTGMVIAVTRIASGKQVATSVVAHTVRRVADDSLYEGDSRTVDGGRDGVVESVYVVTYTNGKVTGRALASRAMTTSMEPAVVAFGTKKLPPPPPTPAASPAHAGGLDWAALASCESGGNPGAVSEGGAYRGLYQFLVSSWQGVGGSGDPINASPAEQTYRAQLLYAKAGASPWPRCGRYL